jgi:hypothetical protein
MVSVTWRGTQREFARLRQSMDSHCECIDGMFGLPPQMCSVHEMLGSQVQLDHLLYVYRMRRIFIRRELYALRARTPVSPSLNWRQATRSSGGCSPSDAGIQ